MTETARNAQRGEEPAGTLLAPWTYRNAEVFELEYEAFFLRRWQFAGHVNEVTEAGSYMTAAIGRDNVIVLRGKDEQLRAFLNVCRHRGSRLLEGAGTCRGVVRCPYHGWTYSLEGKLHGVPMESNFPDFDRTKFGLHEIQLDIFHGLVFVRVRGDGPGVAELFAHAGHYFESYDVANYVPCLEESTQVWNVNWKVAWDNYLENYHIPVGHPGLNRLLHVTDEGEDLPGGVSYGVFELKDKPSKIDVERQYQEQFHHASARVSEDIRGKWVQFGLNGNLGIDLYPEMLDTFQLIPIGLDKTLVRAAFYGHRNPTPEEHRLRELNVKINDPVNDEDRMLCERVHKGLRTSGYFPGPLSTEEVSLYRFHEMLRELVPVTALRESPLVGQVAAENNKLLAKTKKN